MFDSIIKLFLNLLLYLFEHKIALWKLKIQLVGQTHKSRRVIESNATNKVNHYKIKEKDDPKHTQYITWPCQDADNNQRPILQPVSGNEKRKFKKKAEMRHGAKERSTNLTALKLFARQGAEKSQLEEWKADLLHNLTSEIAQIHKAHNDALEAQREEMERQREQFQFEMEVLGERIRELEREKEGSTQGRTQKEGRSGPIQRTPENETTQVPREEIATPDQTQPVNSSGQRSYATVAATKPTQTPSQPWIKSSFGN